MIFICNEFPNLRVYNPGTGDYAQFQGGKIELDPDDVDYEVVKAEAERNPHVTILVNSTTCRLCGEVFTGKAAKPQHATHIKTIHPEVWVAEQELAHAESMAKQVKSTEGFPCDVCQPVQTFGTKSDLSEHVQLLHTQPPAMDAEGNEISGARPGSGPRPGEREIPAATKKG